MYSSSVGGMIRIILIYDSYYKGYLNEICNEKSQP